MSEKNNTLPIGAKYYAMEVVKALIIAIIISLLLVLLSAFIIKTFNLSTDIIPIINQVIRSVSVLIASLISLKRSGNGWLRGIAVGFFYGIFAFLIFSLLSGGFEFDLSLLNNVVICMASGLVSGIISMLIRRN